MRIAILSCFHPYRGGIAQFNANLFAELGKQHNVKAFNFKRQYPDFLFPGKTQYVTPEDEAMEVESVPLLDTVNPLSWAKTAAEIKKWGPDLLVLRYWMPFFAPSLGFVARRMPSTCKVVAILDNVIPHERHWFDTPLTKYFLSGADCCITLCNEVDRDLHKICPGKKSAVLPHPVYSHFGEAVTKQEALRILGIPEGDRTILFFGLIREYKGLDILLEAFGLLPEGYRLIVAGEPYGSFDKYQRIIDSLPGKDRIHLFPQYIRDSQVRDYFCAADVAVLPYRSATQSGISSIAYHFEVPMIVTAVGGLTETIGRRGTGTVTPDGTPEGIAAAITEYFADSGKASCYKENIRKEKVRLGWSRFCEDLIKFASNEQQ